MCGIVSRTSFDTISAAKFTEALAKSAVDLGATVMPHVKVCSWESYSHGVNGPGANRTIVTTAEGTVICKSIVFTTKAHTASLVPEMKGIIQLIFMY